MAAILIPLLLAALGAALTGRAGPRGSIRDALEKAAIAVALWAAAGAELLSLGHHLSRIPLLVWWAVPCALGLLWAWTVRRGVIEAIRSFPSPDARTILLLAPVGAVLTVTFMVALWTPPTTWDCLRYHLPRQVFWMVNAGVQHFPATDIHQLEMPPLAEFIGVQLMVLGQGDRGINLIQWTALALCALVASVIARDLGVRRPGQAFAALMVATLPAAATQAVNAKNDIVLAFFTLALLHQGVRIWMERTCSWKRSLLVGITLGLMVLTKGTSLVLAVPLGLFIAIATIRALGVGRSVPAGVAMLAAASIINAGHWARNYQTFDNPIALPRARGGIALDNQLHTPAGVASIAVRNLVLQMSLPSKAWNAHLVHGVERVHQFLGLSTVDPRTTSLPSYPYEVTNLYPSDGNNPSPVHFLIGAWMLGLLVLRPRACLRAPCWPIYLIPAIAFLLFCTVLAWQPWHNRLLIPIVMLIAPLAAAMFNLPRMDIVRVPAVIAATVLVWPGLLYNESKTLVGPRAIWRLTAKQNRFYVEPGMQPLVDRAVQIAKERKSTSVAIQSGFVNSYPLMYELLHGVDPPPRLTVAHKNFGPEIPASEPDADLIVAWPGESDVSYSIRGSIYEPAFVQAGFCVYARTGPALAPEPAFSEWKSSTNLTAKEGPYARWSLPVIRWGMGPRTKLTFASNGTPCDLVLEARRTGRIDQPLSIVLNEEPLRTVRFGSLNEFIFLRVPMRPRAGDNRLEIVYADTEAGARVTMFRRLQIVPEAPSAGE